MSTSGSSLYGSVADYFGQSGATKSNGKAGGTAGSASQNTDGGDATQGGGQSSGSGWISAAVGFTDSDKSSFTTALSNWQGGITNNQIINSPGSTGAVNTASPSLDAAAGAASPAAAGAAAVNPLELLVLAFAGMALVLYVRGR
jgi:hypothetical protein